MSDFHSIAPSVKLGKDVKLSQFINLYGCEIGDETKIRRFRRNIQKNSRVGNRTKDFRLPQLHLRRCRHRRQRLHRTQRHVHQRHVSACHSRSGGLQTEADWKVEKTRVCKGASVGSGSTILANVTIGEKCDCGCGQVWSPRLRSTETLAVAGNPAKFKRFINEEKK